MTLKKRILSIMFWSVITAAFIGPGTVTTATQAGVYFNFKLQWAFVFSTFGCLVLQEAAARLTIYSQLNLGEAIRKTLEGKSTKIFTLIVVIVSILTGCAAYEAGNILGSTEGLAMIFDIPKVYLVGITGILAIIALSLKSVNAIAKFMGAIVFLMGIAFISVAIMLKPDVGELLEGAFIPSIPAGSGILVLGLVGTTIVPYDLFLGSGALDKKQSIQEMRFGLTIAIVFGGIISMAVMGVGNAITEGMSEGARSNMVYSYDMLKGVLELYIGKSALYVFGFGMFAAGFSSAITSPLASAITASSLFKTEKNKTKWETKSLYFRLVIIGVLGVGLTFGFMQVKPIPAIILAQAINGLFLPLVSIFLLFVVNNAKIMGNDHINGWISNIMMTVVVWITMILGANNIVTSILSANGIDTAELNNFQIMNFTAFNFIFLLITAISFVVSMMLLYKVHRIRTRNIYQS